MIKETQKTNKVAPKVPLTTEIFKDRDLPPFIKENEYFKTKGVPFKKVFRSVGLANFKEACSLSKPLLDLKKENFVSNLIAVMHDGLIKARDEAMTTADRIQFLLFGEEKTAQLEKIDNIYNLLVLVRNLIPQIDTYNNTYEKVVQTSDGKIVLRLVDNVCDRNNNPVFKKNESFFKVFKKLQERFAANNINFLNLEQSEAFKTFGAENVPNKSYMVCFSAEGSEGAWDILTMSMRGIKSCQRWDGDYPRCLIGSILSRYVGVIYITSGADFEGRGTKMMRRSLVRFVMDADEGKPCIVIDRVYPQTTNSDTDEEALKIFMNAIKSKTSLPVYFAPTLGSKVKHFYVPFEKVRAEMPERDWTYQDTPIKNSLDFKLHTLASSSNEDFNRYVNCFKSKLITHMGEYFRNVLNNSIKVDSEIAKTIANIRLNFSIDKFNEQLIKLIFDRAQYNYSNNNNPREAYHKSLIQMALTLKNIRSAQEQNINNHIDSATSRKVDHKAFCDFLFQKVILDCIKIEMKSILQ